MSLKSVTDVGSLKSYMASQPNLSSDASLIDDFLIEAKFEEGQLVGMRYDKLMTKLSINEFLEFLDATGIPRKHFLEPQALGCGKNYTGPKGQCTYSEGNYCYCKDGF